MKKTYGDAIKDLEPMKVNRPPKTAAPAAAEAAAEKPAEPAPAAAATPAPVAATAWRLFCGCVMIL